MLKILSSIDRIDMVEIVPCGLIMFISPAYGGRSCDKLITSNSGFLDYRNQGNKILADWGFSIHDLLCERKVKLKIPAFTKWRALLCEEDNTSTRRTANLRVHVEWIPCRLKHFSPISQVVPINLKLKLDQILIICAALCNLQDVIHVDTEWYIEKC